MLRGDKELHTSERQIDDDLSIYSINSRSCSSSLTLARGFAGSAIKRTAVVQIQLTKHVLDDVDDVDYADPTRQRVLQ